MKASSSILAAVLAAVLFGLSTPLAKALLSDVSPLLLAGLLYLGSGLGLSVLRLLVRSSYAALAPGEWRPLAGAVLCGGVAGPALLMLGLSRTSAGSASLLLNLEAVFTAVLAWIVFREHTDRRMVLGMALIVAGGAVLALPQAASSSAQMPASDSIGGMLAIAAACLCWGLDNNLTRKVSSADASHIAAIKGLVAGSFNLAVALLLGAKLPPAQAVTEALLLGFAGYGASLVLFVLALRGLGSARTGAYFSVAPFVGAVLAVLVFHEPGTYTMLAAALLMAAGVWLHLSERHAHAHVHEALEHLHSHRHDEHHQHEHDFPWDGREPHRHPHRHAPLQHSHRHFPDLHHRHEH